MNSKLSVQKIEKHEIKILDCDGELKIMRTGWAQRPHGFVVLQEVRKIWRVTSTQSFEGQGGEFKPYTPFNRKPVELFKKFTWRQLRRTRMLVQDNPSGCMLDLLKVSNVLKRSAIQDGVQLIQERRNECWCDRESHGVIQLWTNLPERANVVKAGAW